MSNQKYFAGECYTDGVNDFIILELLPNHIKFKKNGVQFKTVSRNTWTKYALERGTALSVEPRVTIEDLWDRYGEHNYVSLWRALGGVSVNEFIDLLHKSKC